MIPHTFRFFGPLPYNSQIRTVWNLVYFVGIMVWVFTQPFNMVVGSATPQFTLVLWSLFFLLEAVFGFGVTVKKGHLHLSDWKQIRKHHLTHWFVWDLAAALPLELILISLGPSLLTSHGEIVFFAGLLLISLPKTVKIRKIFQELQESLGLTPGVARLLNFASWFALAVHFMSLGWILIGATEAFRSAEDQYLRALYWVTTTIATIGYGDYLPDHDSNLQIIYTIVVQLFGVGFYSYTIANVSSLVNNLDLARASHQRRMEEVRAYLKSQKVPMDVQKRVTDYYSYLWEARRSSTSSPVLHDLPSSLQLEILLLQNETMIRSLEVFWDATEILVREAVRHLQPKIFLPEEWVITEGEIGHSMFFLTEGSMAVIKDGAEQAKLGSGSLFGETALVTDGLRNASIRSLEYGTGYELSKHHFNDLRSRYPDFDKKVQRIVDSRKVN